MQHTSGRRCETNVFAWRLHYIIANECSSRYVRHLRRSSRLVRVYTGNVRRETQTRVPQTGEIRAEQRPFAAHPDPYYTTKYLFNSATRQCQTVNESLRKRSSSSVGRRCSRPVRSINTHAMITFTVRF